jgi:hypothetical protein
MIPGDLANGTKAAFVNGHWQLDAERCWSVEGPREQLDQVIGALGPVAQRMGSSVVLLKFGNSIGRYHAGPLGSLCVRSGKWAEDDYDRMLGDISRRAAALPFHAGATSALPYSRTELDSPDIIYHAFVWLRHAVLDGDAPLLGALRAILNDPHRRLTHEARLVPAANAVRLSPRAIEEIAHGARPFARVPRGRGLLGGDLFPVEVNETFATPSVDTAENRFVLAFLRSCSALVEGMRARVASNPTRLALRVRGDCDAIEAELASVLRHGLWREVGTMSFFPSSSTILQRRSAYREVLRHHVLLRMASKALPLSSTEVALLLEAKDIARLYELWTAFAVIEAVREHKGDPVRASRPDTDELGAKLGSGLMAEWADGTKVAYNQTFSRNTGFHGHSWSVPLRPDVALWVPSGPSAGLHLLDAKFRLEGTLDADGALAEGHAKTSDLHKMHAYRDAIEATRSAWVMYPGSEFRAWCVGSAPIDRVGNLPTNIDGLGAIPIVPGEGEGLLRGVVGRLLGGVASPAPLPA